MATQSKPSTPKLVSRGGGGQLFVWIVLAFAVHAVLIGATSVGYIRDLMDPAGTRVGRRKVSVRGSIVASELTGPLAGMTLADLVNQMTAGGTYVNVHTNDGVAPADTGPGDFPGGEIRGQVRRLGRAFNNTNPITPPNPLPGY